MKRLTADDAVAEWQRAPPKEEEPQVLTVTEILALNVPAASMLIDGILPLAGASLLVGAAKSGKTLLAIQMAISVASGDPLFGEYKVLKRGPVLIIEQDDPAGVGSVKTILERSPVPVADIPFHLVVNVPYQFGPDFLMWLENQIVRLSARLCVLDSYTALRASRGKGVDIVKAEQDELRQLDALAKRTGCALLIVHHSSKGSAGLDWSEKAAGTFAMSAATESQIFVSRFNDLDSTAPERLIRLRGRHSEDLQLVLRFRSASLDFEQVLAGGGSPLYPEFVRIQRLFEAKPFSPKDLSHETGLSRATIHRQIHCLLSAGVLSKRGHGEYIISL